MLVRSAIATLILGGCVFAQQAAGTRGARALYYFGHAEKEAMPPVTRVADRRPGTAARTKQQAKTTKTAADASAQTTAEPPVPQGVAHLGLRYNLVLVDARKRTATAVDSDRNFRKGECFAIDFEANRSGYLYVLAKQSSGAWMPLFPSKEMVGESNVINPGQKVRVPSQYCFEITDPPGTEKLFVVLSRDAGDVRNLHEGIRQQEAPAAEPAPATGAPAGSFQIASAHLVNGEVSRLQKQTVYDRDLKIVKVAEPESAQETPHSVYVVTASEKPQSRVVTEINVKHQ